MISSLKCFIRQPRPILGSEMYKLLKHDENHESMNSEQSTIYTILFLDLYSRLFIFSTFLSRVYDLIHVSMTPKLRRSFCAFHKAVVMKQSN